MKKGYWVGQVKEIKNQEKWSQYLEKFMNIVAEEAEKKSGNFVPTASSEPKFYIQKNFDLLYSAVVEFNSVQDAIDGYNDPRYQDALAYLGENKEDVVVRNLVIIEAN